MQFIRSTLLLLLLVAAVQNLQAQVQLLKEQYKTYSQHKYQSLRYGLYTPPDYDKNKSYPLIVYLHGSTDTVSRDMAWYRSTFQKDHPCFVLTPKCDVSDQGWGNTWTSSHSQATAATLRLVDSLVARYAIDKNRLYIYGISMGGFGVFSILDKNPGLFAAAYVVCGGSSEKAAVNVMKTPLWIFHGEIDDVVLIKYSRQLYDEIVRLGGRKVRYTGYPGVRHNSWENVNQEKTLSDWLFSQKKGSTAEHPAAPAGFALESKSADAVQLKWDKPDTQVWYYKLLRNDKLLAEIDGDRILYRDNKLQDTNPSNYSLIAVDYFFQESKPVRLELKTGK